MQVISNPANGMRLKNVILSRFNRREKTKTNSWLNDLIGASKLKKTVVEKRVAKVGTLESLLPDFGYEFHSFLFFSLVDIFTRK